LPQALVRAGNLNLDLAEHQATRIERGGLAAADLVVGFERSHVAAAVIEGGAARERAFTLPEFVPLAENVVVEEGRDPVERARLVVRAAAAARSTAQGRALPELRDPAGGPERGYDAVAAELVSLSRRLVRALFGAHAS
jgi:protein-tyrosine-phosphatase